MTQNISNKVVVITGASSGLGEATARHLGAQGALLVLGARRKDKLDGIAAELRDAGVRVETLAVDVTRRAEVQALADLAVSRFGRIDVIVNNAGYMAIAPLAETKVEEWDRMLDVNVRGVLHGIAATLPLFRTQGSGHFINVASVGGFKVFGGSGAVYSATKFAVRAISEGVRLEVGGAIRTTIISPGAVESELKEHSSHEDSIGELGEFYKMAIPAASVARAIAYAIEQPADVDISEIVLRPTAQEF